MHAVRNLCQWVAKLTKPAMDGVTHWVVQGHFKLWLFLLYQALNNNELDEIHEKKFVSFQSRRSKSSATAGQADKSRTERGKHSVSSGLQAWRSSMEN